MFKKLDLGYSQEYREKVALARKMAISILTTIYGVHITSEILDIKKQTIKTNNERYYNRASNYDNNRARAIINEIQSQTKQTIAA